MRNLQNGWRKMGERAYCGSELQLAILEVKDLSHESRPGGLSHNRGREAAPNMEIEKIARGPISRFSQPRR